MDTSHSHCTEITRAQRPNESQKAVIIDMMIYGEILTLTFGLFFYPLFVRLLSICVSDFHIFSVNIDRILMKLGGSVES